MKIKNYNIEFLKNKVVNQNSEMFSYPIKVVIQSVFAKILVNFRG